MDGQPDILRGCARLGQRSSPPGSSHGWFRGPVTGKEAGESGLQPGKAVGSPGTGCSGADRAPPAPEPRFRARGFTAEACLGAPAQGPVLALTAPAGPCGRWEAALLESGSSVPGTLPRGQAPRESRPRPQGPPGSPGGLPPRLGTACLSPGETNEKGGRPELGGSQPQGSLTCSGRSRVSDRDPRLGGTWAPSARSSGSGLSVSVGVQPGVPSASVHLGAGLSWHCGPAGVPVQGGLSQQPGKPIFRGDELVFLGVWRL